ncbi:MAG TPA: carboxylesterase/lipase family protein [Steroidobacteraceae bacterium]|jgi:para-nitrobenzyl esterase|nr:carboxylesterase/lipase family protein [Steroidobacteraceae bacterium]
MTASGSDQGSHRIDRRTFVAAASVAVVTGAMLNKIPLAAAADSGGGASGPIVETTAGKLRGGQQGSVAYFKGVHYGASPVGERRFLPPHKAEPWSGLRDATQLGLRSPQLPSTLIPEVAAVDPQEPMGEDCLCLNVWTPSGSHTHRRPVMVWLHGGGFTSGSGGFRLYDGTNLAAHHDVVVITVNHRLNAFGFLFLPDVGGAKYAQASNVGMLDIVQALEWVRDNVAAFGGDPGNVTIFGQSGGGSKVSTLMAMPAARGLFHRAIVQSGSSIKGVSREAANQSTAAFLAKAGIATGDVDKLQSLTMQQLLAAQTGGGVGNPALRFAPVVDGSSLPTDPFDPVAPTISAHVPLLVGSTQDEIGFFRGAALDPIDESALAPRVKQTLHASDEQTAAVIAAYRKDQPGISPIDIAIEVASDMFAWKNALTQAERKAAQHVAPVYMYYFTWKSPVREGKLRAFHTLDIPFAFDNVEVARSMTGTAHDRYALQNRMSSAWVAFARTGNPNTPTLPHWPAYDSAQRATMILDNDCRLVNDPRPDDREALRSV